MGSSPRSDGSAQGAATAGATSTPEADMRFLLAQQMQPNIAQKLQQETMARRSTGGYGGRGAPWTGGGMPARR